VGNFNRKEIETMSQELSPVPIESGSAEPTRSLYIRRVPEGVWIKVHENALHSRMRLKDYLLWLMSNSTPCPNLPRSNGS
jgi:hypothetical protein